MSNPYQTCTVCKAPPEVLEAINAAIRKREKFRDLAARTAFSRATLHRHSQKCLQRAALAEHKARIVNAQSGRMIVQWPTGALSYGGTPIHPEDLRQDDFLLVVRYEKRRASAYGNLYSPTAEQIAELVEMAINEDAQRAAVKLDSSNAT
jgi:hypothetical protein